ncbi:MAG TPA: SRPBCC family protein [Bacteroidia bacterium]|jgi:uncharacterized protein YndB with AHSA1/START domain|nr:SRPBCC family protein [Bacteroidia bacterium]
MTAETFILIDASPDKVWEALTTPELIKKYLMDTNVRTDWKEGSAIHYEGEYQGKKYKDKGVIKKIEPLKVLQTTYWSSMSGKEDKPENYNLVTYRLTESGGKTKISISQDNVASEKEKEHSTNNWNSVLAKMKDVVEGLNTRV